MSMIIPSPAESLLGGGVALAVRTFSGVVVGGYDLSDGLLFGFSHVLVAGMVYYTLGTVMFALELLKIPAVEARRLQKRPRSPRDWKEMLRCFLDVSVMQVLAAIPSVMLFYGPMAAFMGCSASVEDMPSSWVEVAWGVLVAALVNDFMFYWMHRAMHHPLLYKRFHKQHHKYKAPFSWSSEFASLPELVIVDALPMFAGLWVTKAHLLTQYVWVIIRLIYTLEIHSGYDFWVWRLIPFYGGAPMHDYHHKQFNGNYSDCFVIWDKLFGTYLEPPPLGMSDKQPDGKPRESRSGGQTKSAHKRE